MAHVCTSAMEKPEELPWLTVGFLYTIAEQPIEDPFEAAESWAYAHTGKVCLQIDTLTLDTVKVNSNCPLLRNIFSQKSCFGQWLPSKSNKQLASAYYKAVEEASRVPDRCFEFTGKLCCGSKLGVLTATCSVLVQMPENTNNNEDLQPQVLALMSDFKPHVLRRNTVVGAKKNGKRRTVRSVAGGSVL